MRNEKEKNRLKIRFYIMSLWLLFLLLFILTVDIACVHDDNGNFTGILNVLKNNWLSLINMVFFIIGFILAKVNEYEWKGTKNPPYKVLKVKNVNFEYLTFLTTCIIPLICIDMEKIRNVIVMGIILLVIGLIFIRMDLYYGNPTLALMGYRIYRVTIDNPKVSNDVILISKDHIHSKQQIKWIPVDKYVWIAQVIKK